MNNKAIALRMRELRERREITQEEVADVLGIKQPAYSDLENGISAFKAVHLDKLAGFYGLSLDELLREDACVLNMHDNASHAYIRSEVQNGVNEELLKRVCDVLDSSNAAIKELTVLVNRLSGKGG